MKTRSIIKYAGIIILSVIVGIGITYTNNNQPVIILEEHEPRMSGDPTNPKISYEGVATSRTLLPYTKNYNVPFDYEGRIDYDLLIKKLLPPLWKDKLNSIGVDVNIPHMVLLRGPQIAMYQENSYQCGYVIDDDKDNDKQVYWLEGRIDKSKIYDVKVFTENPMPCEPNTGSCWCTAETLAEEQLLDFEDISTFNYEIESDGATYGSQYEITGGTVDKITYDSHSNSLIVSLNESEKGYITIVIQTGLLHSSDQLPFTYFVLVDKEEVVFEQLSPMVLKIPFEKDTEEIEIIGTFW